MRIRKSAIAGLLTAIVFATANLAPTISAAQEKKSDNLIPINIGLPISNYWPAYVARYLKLFEKVGLKPTFYSFTTGAPLIAGMKSGSLDVAWTGLATLFMLGQDIPLTFVLVPLDSSSQMAFVASPKSGINSYKDLAKSKNIAAPTATCAEVSLVLAAKKAGVPMSSLKSSNLAPPVILTALQNGQVDSTFMWGPWNLLYRNAGFKIVNWDKDFQIAGGVCATTAAARPKFLEDHPSVGCKLVKVHALALAEARKHPELAIKTMEDAFGTTHAIAKETYDTLLIPTIKSQLDPKSPWSLTNKDGGLSEKLFVAGQALYEAGDFKKPLSKETIWKSIDSKYIKQYLDSDCKS